MRAIWILMACSISFQVVAQKTGEADYPYLGIKFTIPSGWKGAESGEGFVMASDTKPGLVFMTPHQVKNLDELKNEAESGLQQEGISLKKTSPFDEVGKNGIGAEFTGLIQGQSAKAYIASVINPLGSGVTIVAATTEELYSQEYKNLALAIAMSLKFSDPVEPPVTQEWREALKGARLTYLKSNYSSGASYNGYSTYSGYSSHNEIMLCPNGNFTYNGNNSMAIDTGGASASGSGKTNGQGAWSITANAQGIPVLNLTFNNGEIYTYRLSYENQKTYLNGERYFRVYDARCN